LARAIGAREEEILVASTGVIGWRLPVEKMVGSIEEMFAHPTSGAGPADDPGPTAARPTDALALARAIMTTDSYPKLTSIECDGGRIVGVAKGAGMIEPHMATMLSFLFTDIAVDGDHLRRALAAAVAESFNAISVDGDQSTSDMVLVFSSARRSCSDLGEFDEALTGVCQRLAKDVVRNGEGVSHLLEITVRGAPDSDIARELARSVANSPLVKTAVYGNDPNVGRLVMAIGDFCGRTDLDPVGLTIQIGGTVVYQDGEFHLDGDTEDALAGYLRSASIDPTIKGYPQSDAVVAVEIGLTAGAGSGRVWGADLSYEYVRENADYRT
jgi:glutamate N-acetyltransferase/amino-acid N-acetyltransferase